jgi:hypothetical protein
MLRLAVMFRRSGHRQIKQALEMGMAGEIRAKMAALKAAKEKMLTDMGAEIDAVAQEVAATRADGLDAMKLPRAELESTKAEIREIRAEFATATNGGPPGPLPGSPAASPPQSVVSKPSPQDSADGKSSTSGQGS